MTSKNVKTLQEKLAERDKPENIHEWIREQKGQPADIHEFIRTQNQATKEEQKPNESTKNN
jgi:hypothetical protein